MAITIRDFESADTPWIVDLLVRWDPTLPADLYERTMMGAVGRIIRNRVAERDGVPVASGVIIDFESNPHPMCSVVVDEQARGEGVGRALFADLWPQVPGGVAVTGMPDNDPTSVEIARHWGFEELGHGIDSVVRLDAEPDGPTMPVGVVVRVVDATEATRLGVDGFLAQVGDYPEVEQYGGRMSHEALLRMAPDSFWLLATDDEGIAAGVLIDPREDGEWYVMFTGVAPRSRRQGLGRAMKQAAHRVAFERGATSVRTTNEHRNERIRALNASLGYTAVSGDLRLIRRG